MISSSPRIGRLLSAIGVLFFMPASVTGQAKCVSALMPLDSAFATDAPDEACLRLAGVLVDTLSAPLVDSLKASMRGFITPRELQPLLSETSGVAGTLGDGSAVPTVRPVGLASGSLTAVGTRAGTGSLASLSVNPLVSFLLGQATEYADSVQLKRFARLSRELDISAFFPVRDQDANGDGKLDYFGLRVRWNRTGADAGTSVWTGASTALGDIVSEEVQIEEEIESAILALATEAEVTACSAAILSKDVGSVRTACGASIDTQPDQAAYGRLGRALAGVREQADSEYRGLDLRLDFGDPTLGEVPGASGTFAYVGWAQGGRRPTESGLSPLGYRYRVGARYAELDASGETDFAVELGGAVEVVGVHQGRQMSFSSGLEGRWGRNTDMESEFQSGYWAWRTALTVPLTDRNNVTLAWSRTLKGDTHLSPAFSVAGDWGLLLPGLSGG